ncbi:MAG: hypothetical protein WBF81_02585 [Thermoplasmata archaeon]
MIRFDSSDAGREELKAANCFLDNLFDLTANLPLGCGPDADNLENTGQPTLLGEQEVLEFATAEGCELDASSHTATPPSPSSVAW